MNRFLRICAFLSIVAFSEAWTPGLVLGKAPGLKQPSFDSNGVPIHYLVTGKETGEPVLLIHGFAGSIEIEWTPVIQALKGQYKIIGMDCRGHGGSGKPHDPKLYGNEMVADAARLLDHLHIEKAHVVGYSMGAGIALKFAARYPHRVLTATLGGTGVSRGQEGLALLAAESLESGRGLRPVVIALNPKGAPEPSPEMIKKIDDGVLSRNDPLALAAVARGTAADMPNDKEVVAISAPVQAIIGSEDPLRPGVDILKELLPSTQIVVIDHANHMSALLRPEFIQALSKFLAQHSKH